MNCILDLHRQNSAHDADGLSSGLISQLNDIIAERRLIPLFQPIIDLQSGTVVGYEGFTRGPSDSPLHPSARLFSIAKRQGLECVLETAACSVLTERFSRLNLPGKLFLKLSAKSASRQSAESEYFWTALAANRLPLHRIVVEAMSGEFSDYADICALHDIVVEFRRNGLQIALSDLSEKSSSLILWLSSRPDFIKIDGNFVQYIDKIPLKIEFVRSLAKAAHEAGCSVVAEGIETHAELRAVSDMGIKFGQGYHIERPSPYPRNRIPAESIKELGRADKPGWRDAAAIGNALDSYNLLEYAPVVSGDTTNGTVYKIFEDNEEVEAIVVLENGKPAGLIVRHEMIDRYAKPYQPELYGRKPCALLMDKYPLIVDKHMPIHEVGHIVSNEHKRYLRNGFIITDSGYYLGYASGHNLMREITNLQIDAARYANPLTQLPGNIPIQERIGTSLSNGLRFAVCYCDLDYFKPYNDVYGFSKGDEIIRMVARILRNNVAADQDFVGHLGGDDFIVVFGSADWENRCRSVLEDFGKEVLNMFGPDDRERGGYIAENRKGEKEFHPLTTLSIGGLEVDPGAFDSCLELSRVAAETKKVAKTIPGNSFFVNRRKYSDK